MTYVLLFDPYDDTYAVMQKLPSGIHHLALGWENSKNEALHTFMTVPHLTPLLLDSGLVDRVQIISEFTHETHPEFFI